VAKNREALPQTGSSAFPPQAGKQQFGQSVARMPGAVHGQIGKERKGFLVRQGDCLAVLGDKGRSQECKSQGRRSFRPCHFRPPRGEYTEKSAKSRTADGLANGRQTLNEHRRRNLLPESVALRKATAQEGGPIFEEAY
jgi:hypothetical protein